MKRITTVRSALCLVFALGVGFALAPSGVFGIVPASAQQQQDQKPKRRPEKEPAQSAAKLSTMPSWRGTSCPMPVEPRSMSTPAPSTWRSMLAGQAIGAGDASGVGVAFARWPSPLPQPTHPIPTESISAI